MQIIRNEIVLRKGAAAPPASNDLIEHLEWVCVVTQMHSRQSVFAYGLMANWAKYANFSDKQIETAKNLCENVREAFDKGATS